MSDENFHKNLYHERTSKLWIPPVKQKGKELNSHSWFNFLERKNPNPTKEPAPTKMKKVKIMRIVERIKIYPNNEQRDFLLKWIKQFKQMYNITNQFIKDRLMDSDNKPRLPYKEAKKFLNFQQIRNTLLPQKALMLINQISSHMLDDALKHCVAKYKTCMENFNAKRCKEFRIRDWDCNKRRETLIFEASCFSKMSSAICISVLGEMKSSDTLQGISHTANLVFDRLKGTWVMMVPGYIDGFEPYPDKVAPKSKKNPRSKGSLTKNLPPKRVESRQCGIDPGMREFLTIYSPNKMYDVCTLEYVKFKKIFKKIDKLKKHLEQGKISPGKCRRAMSKRNDYLRNLVSDMHWKIGKFLCLEFDKIVIGKFSTKQAISTDGDLPTYVKRVLVALSHFSFRAKLQMQAEKYGSVVIEANECLTTKTCSKCGHVQDMGKKKIYDCGNSKCKIKMGRDDNAARNIYGKY
jgi:IS605 OrfB family transposase